MKLLYKLLPLLRNYRNHLLVKKYRGPVIGCLGCASIIVIVIIILIIYLIFQLFGGINFGSINLGGASQGWINDAMSKLQINELTNLSTIITQRQEGSMVDVIKNTAIVILDWLYTTIRGFFE